MRSSQFIPICLRPGLLALVLLLGAPAQVSAQVSSQVQAAEPLSNFNLVLLQPSAVLEQRVPNVDAMAAYVKAVEAAARAGVLSSGAQQSVGGFIVLAVKPGGKAKVWLDFDAMLDLQLRQQIIAKVEAVPPFEVVKGPVVFALKVATWGAKASKRIAPAPLEWKALPRNGEALEVGELVERLWAD